MTLPVWQGDNKTVEADLISKIEDFTPTPATEGAKTLIFEGGKRAHLPNVWINLNQPKVGGYFVIDDKDNRKCYYMSGDSFKANFIKTGE